MASSSESEAEMEDDVGDLTLEKPLCYRDVHSWKDGELIDHGNRDKELKDMSENELSKRKKLFKKVNKWLKETVDEALTSKKESFQCRLCPIEGETCFASLYYLRNHLVQKHLILRRKHVQRRPYVCEYEGCSRRYAQIQNLQNHARAIHMKELEDFACEECGKRFYKASHVMEHQKTHKKGIEKAKLTCSSCGLKLSSHQSLTKHVFIDHKDLAEYMQKTKNICQFCRQTFRSIAQREEHIIDEHEERLPWKVKERKMEDERLRRVVDVLRDPQETEKLPRLIHAFGITDDFNCSTCGEVYARSDKLLNHHRREHKEWSIQADFKMRCRFCDYYSKFHETQTHMLVNHSLEIPWLKKKLEAKARTILAVYGLNLIGVLQNQQSSSSTVSDPLMVKDDPDLEELEDPVVKLEIDEDNYDEKIMENIEEPNGEISDESTSEEFSNPESSVDDNKAESPKMKNEKSNLAETALESNKSRETIENDLTEADFAKKKKKRKKRKRKHSEATLENSKEVEANLNPLNEAEHVAKKKEKKNRKLSESRLMTDIELETEEKDLKADEISFSETKKAKKKKKKSKDSKVTSQDDKIEMDEVFFIETTLAKKKGKKKKSKNSEVILENEKANSSIETESVKKKKKKSKYSKDILEDENETNENPFNESELVRSKKKKIGKENKPDELFDDTISEASFKELESADNKVSVKKKKKKKKNKSDKSMDDTMSETISETLEMKLPQSPFLVSMFDSLEVKEEIISDELGSVDDSSGRLVVDEDAVEDEVRETREELEKCNNVDSSLEESMAESPKKKMKKKKKKRKREQTEVTSNDNNELENSFSVAEFVKKKEESKSADVFDDIEDTEKKKKKRNEAGTTTTDIFAHDDRSPSQDEELAIANTTAESKLKKKKKKKVRENNYF